MARRTIVLIAIFTLLFVSRAAAQGAHSVSGNVKFHKEGKIYILIVTQKEFDGKSGAHGQVLDVGPAEIKAGQVPFAFHNLPAGDYAIKAFQDVNDNGELDSGTFGPKEPWGFYKDVRPTFRGPKWDEVKFPVNKDLSGIPVEVK